MNNSNTLDILETEFGFDDIRSVYSSYNNDYALDYFVIDLYIFKRSPDDVRPLKFIELIPYVQKGMMSSSLIQRNIKLIDFMRKNKDMIYFWML